ncbi:MAG: hypothetical protein ABI867_36585 [Kofleriaceae bacterium]
MRATALLALTGCSFIAMKEPPQNPMQITPTAPDCTASKAAPVLDIAAAVAAGTVGLAFLLAAAFANSLDGGDDDADTLAITGLVIGIGGGVGFTASGVSGFRKARQCRAAEEAFNFSRSPVYGGGQQVITPPPAIQLGAPGSERGFCRPPPEAPCDAGLTCASNYCVVLPPLAPR